MKFRRHKDREQGGIYGGAWSQEIDGERLGILYDRPTSEAILEVEPTMLMLGQRIVCAMRALARYQEDRDPSAKTPTLTVQRDELQPLLDFLRHHLRELRGVVDEVTGEPLTLEDLEPDELDDLLISGLTLDHLMDLTRAVMRSAGLPDELRERCRTYFRAVIDRNQDLPLEQCPQSLERLESIAPYEDVNALVDRLQQYSSPHGGLTQGAPIWLREVEQIRASVARARQARLEKRRKQKQRALGHYGDRFK
jgi:hypothetical protein